MAPSQVSFGAEMRRQHFAFAADYLPLNHGSYGTHPTAVRDAHLALRAEAEAAPDPFIVLNFPGRLAAQRALAARLLNCPVGELAFVPNATTGIDTVLKNLPFADGDVILCYESIYGAVAYGANWIAEYHRRFGVEVRVEVVPVAIPLSDDAFVEAMTSAARCVNAESGRRVRLAIVDTIVSLPGVRVPFERLVPALQAEGALVLVDGAHAIGHIDVDLAQLRPDFFVSNLHKWLFVPRGCAAFYVPERNQPLIRTMLPTGWGFKPVDLEDKGAIGQTSFPEGFDFIATNDRTHWLCVEAAVKFRDEVCGGEKRIQEYSNAVARRGGEVAAEVLGTEVLDCAGSCLRDCSFANVRLPLDLDSITSPDAVTPWLKTVGTAESGIYYQTILYRGHWYWRLSGTIYLEEADFQRGAEVLKGLCERVAKGEHVPKS